MLLEIKSKGAAMPAWEAITDGLDRGGYVAWETAVDAALGGSGRDHVPMFVALEPPVGMSLLQAIDATLALPGLCISQHERDLLTTERALLAKGAEPVVRAVVFWPRAKLTEVPDFWRVIHVGPGLAIAEDAEKVPGADLTLVSGDLDPAVPLVAVIDDGIGFLNARFRRDRAHTRIRGIWLQAAERAGSTGTIVSGRVLGAGEIDEMIAGGGDEAEAYRTLNRALFRRGEQAQTLRHAAHGTHVLDLAAGAPPLSGEPDLGAGPILAVQLPGSSIRETLGRRMEANMVQGLRWILAEALRQANLTDVPPVVVNVSLGSLAGPGDSHAFLAEWLVYEVARHHRMTGGGEVRLVIAYGNARMGRLVARDAVRRSQPMELIWRVQPDDHSSSFLELRADLTQVASLRLRLVPPTGSGLPELNIPWPGDKAGWRLAGPIASVSASHEDGGQSHVHLALGPTAGTGPMPPAPSGAWRVEVQTVDIEPVRVTAKVQRDDTPQGYRTLGRQSWLDHPQGWDWDAELRAYLAPRAADDAPGCPVTREGTAVAYAGADDERILFVGAGRPVAGQPGKLRPTVYSSEGVRNYARPGESRGPSLIAMGDTGTLPAGVRASGVQSGSTARMSGTSMAAPQVTRALARYFQTVPKAERSLKKERQFLTGNPDWDDPDARSGNGALIA